MENETFGLRRVCDDHLHSHNARAPGVMAPLPDDQGNGNNDAYAVLAFHADSKFVERPRRMRLGVQFRSEILLKAGS